MSEEEKDNKPEFKIYFQESFIGEAKGGEKKQSGFRKKSFLIIIGLLVIILIVLGIVFFQFGFLKKQSRLVEKEEPLKETTPTQPIVLPQLRIGSSRPKISESVASPTQLTSTNEKVSKENELMVSQPQAEEAFIKQFVYPWPQNLFFIERISSLEVKMTTLTFDEYEKRLKEVLSFQKASGALINLNFTFNNQKIPLDIILDYFFKPSRISEEKVKSFKEELTGNYAFLIYYSYTRKNPILVLEIKNPAKMKIFNDEWENKKMVSDLKTLFLGFDPGKPLRNYFISKEYNSFAYRIIYFDNNYSLSWLLTPKFLIYSSAEDGLKLLSFYLK